MSFDNEREFTLVKKGFDPGEVYARINELKAQNAELHSRNTELEQKLDTARRLVRRFTDMENGLRQNIADSKRAAAAMIADTKERSETLLDKTRESCGEIISDLDMQISERMNTVDNMKAAVAQFKKQLFDLYSSHIELIEAISGHTENFEYQPDYSAVADAVEEFEANADTEVQLPEFEEYPEESIFEELNNETETKTAEPEAAEVSVQEPDIPEEDGDETEETAETEETVPDISEDFESFENFESFEDNEYAAAQAEDGDDSGVSDEQVYEEETSEEAPEEAQPETAARDDDEYVRFLNNFISGDEEQ